jgi:hypothetical protein
VGWFWQLHKSYCGISKHQFDLILDTIFKAEWGNSPFRFFSLFTFSFKTTCCGGFDLGCHLHEYKYLLHCGTAAYSICADFYFTSFGLLE